MKKIATLIAAVAMFSTLAISPAQAEPEGYSMLNSGAVAGQTVLTPYTP